MDNTAIRLQAISTREHAMHAGVTSEALNTPSGKAEAQSAPMDQVRTGTTKKRRIGWIAFGAFVGLALLAFLNLQGQTAGFPVSKASLALGTVAQGELRVRVHGNGTLLPATIAQVSTSVEGRVDQLLIKAGNMVQQDEILMVLKNPGLLQMAEELAWALEAQQAEINAAKVRLRSEQMNMQTQVLKTEFAYKSAKLMLDAENQLLEKHGQVISALEHERTQLNVDQLQESLRIDQDRLSQFATTMRAEISANEAKLSQVRKRLERANQQVESLHIRAPIAGVVQAITAELGQSVVLGSTVAKVVDPKSLYAELRIPEQQARDLALKQKAEIDTRMGLIHGEVIRIDPSVVSGMVKVDVQLNQALPNGARPDLSIDGTIDIAKLEHALYLPRPAQTQPKQRGKLYRLTSNDQAELVDVEYGIASVNVIEIKSGLKPGDRIVLNDTSLWGSPTHLQLN